MLLIFSTPHVIIGSVVLKRKHISNSAINYIKQSTYLSISDVKVSNHIGKQFIGHRHQDEKNIFTSEVESI
jgi:hypothetical protein